MLHHSVSLILKSYQFNETLKSGMNVSVVVSSIVVRLSTKHMSLFGTRNHFYRAENHFIRCLCDRGCGEGQKGQERCAHNARRQP